MALYAHAPDNWVRQAGPHCHGHRAEAAELLPTQSLCFLMPSCLILFVAPVILCVASVACTWRIFQGLAAQPQCCNRSKGRRKHHASLSGSAPPRDQWRKKL